MYRKLKNILGVSLMVLAVVLAQIPMPEAQAEIENQNAVAQSGDSLDGTAQNNTITVTFSMNGGNFYGTYNDYEFKNQSPVLVLDSKEKIGSYPSDKSASYNSYRTDKEIWYTDKECLTVFDKESEVTESITLYKKWYSITSDGKTLADKGFYISPDGTVLYKYDGNDIHVEIPDTVTTIASGAFESLDEVRGITLPANIEKIDDNAFPGAESGEKIIYIYDSQTEQSKHFGKVLDDKYEQLVYSEYLDKDKVQEMVGIDYSGTGEVQAAVPEEVPQSETSEKPQSISDNTTDSTAKSLGILKNIVSSNREELSKNVIVVDPEQNSQTQESEKQEGTSEDIKTSTTEEDSTAKNEEFPEDEEVIGKEDVSNNKEVLHTESSLNEESSEAKSSSNEESSETKPSPSEEGSETKPSPSEESSETKSSSNEESSEAKSSSNEESSETKSSSNEESSEAKSSSNEESSEAKSSSNEESSEAKSSSNEESSENPEESSTPGVIEIDPDKKYTVTFNTGISGVSGEKREVLNGRTISEMVSVDGKQPTLLKKGAFKLLRDDGSKEITYTFAGWYKDSQYTTAWDFANDTVEGDTTIYAKWDSESKAYYYITFKAEGAKNIPEQIKVYEGEKAKKPSKTPKMTNKEFKGWYMGEENSAKKFTGWNKPITENITLYARWEDNGYSVTFDMNGGGFTGNYSGGEYTNAASIKTKIALGKGIASSEYPESVTSAAMKYNSYNTDSNWYTDKECLSPYSRKNSSGSDTVLKNDLTLYKKWYYTSSGFTMNPSGAVLYKYNGSSENVVIPSTVTTIGENAFSNLSGVSSITLPEKISDVRSNALSGLEKVSKDVTITAPANAESAQKKAQELAKQYKHLVYKNPTENTASTAKNKDDNETVSIVDAGTIKLGASSVGNNTNNNTNTEKTTDKNNNTSKITVGVNGASVLSTTAQQVSNAVTLANAQAQANAAKAAAVIAPDTGIVLSSDSAAGASATATPSGTAGTSVSGSTANASSISNKNTAGTVSNTGSQQTTVRNSAAAASAPRSTEHIKDATPKTGDPIQYRMLLVCCLFSIGVLLLLTGNGNKKKAAAS